MRLVGYIRVSQVRGREGDSFISPDVQRQRIAAIAVARGHTVTDWIEDLDESGAKIDRPGFQQAIQMVERGEVDGIAVAKLDRFARSTVDTEMTIRRLEAAGGALVAGDIDLDTSTPTGKLMRTMLAALAEFELDRIRENWRVATERHIARGAHHGKPPLGYAKTDDGSLVPDDAAAAVVRKVFELRASGVSWLRIREKVGGNMTRSTLSTIIRNRTYLGEVRAGEFVLEAAHEPLVDLATWEAAQSARMLMPRRERGSLLAGLLVCASCGRSMSVEWDGKRGYSNYSCRKFHGGVTCTEPAKISMKRADGYITDQFLGWASVALEGAASSSVQGIANQALEQAEVELSSYLASAAVSIVGERVFMAGLEPRQRKVDAARAEVAAVRSRGNVVALGRVSSLAEEWPNLDLDERRLILAAAIDEVVCSRSHLAGQGSVVADRLRVRWSGALDRPDELRLA